MDTLHCGNTFPFFSLFSREIRLSPCVLTLWVVISRYRTVLCNRGAECRRVLCFFAHSYEELRLTVASRMPGLADMGDVDLADMHGGQEQSLEKEGADELENTDLPHDDGTSSALSQRSSSCISSPSSSVDERKAPPEADATLKPVPDVETKGQVDTGWTLSHKFVDKQASTESLASLKIFSLLANAARIQESLHQELPEEAVNKDTSLSHDSKSTKIRATAHRKSHSFSTVGQGKNCSRQQSIPAGLGGANLRSVNESAIESVEQTRYLSPEAYSPMLGRSNSVDVASLHQMLPVGRCGSKSSRRMSGLGVKARRSMDRNPCPPPMSTPLGTAGYPGLGASDLTMGSHSVHMTLQGGWNAHHGNRFPTQTSSAGPVHPSAGLNTICSDLGILGIENWHQVEQVANKVSLSDLLNERDPSLVDVESLQELQNMYLPPDCISEVQNLLQGSSFPESAICENSAVLMELCESSFGIYDSQDWQ